MPALKFTLIVKPQARLEKVERLPDGALLVWVRAPAREGKANRACLEALSEYFKVPVSRITLVHGARGKHKIVEVLT